ncbi:unnamed protein product [Allacma fusca]|uniref:Uncharacterized protein n=1 Tax=Allacma fusca TaxID=39272 RepID=A0A8J2PRL5_9HEXA|nr:unnamed protein product [Allacma fusca]
MDTYFGIRSKNTERDIYILSGVCGGVSLLLLILFISILVSNSRLRAQTNQMIRDTPFEQHPKAVQNEYGHRAPPPTYNQAVQFQ